MKYFQKIYFLTFIFASFIASIISKIMKVDVIEVLTFLLVSYTFYHILEWKYDEGDNNGIPKI